MRRIAVINQKGGVGKTTTSANLGAALAEAGRRVVVVDLDPQANLTLHLDCAERAAKSVYEVLTGDCSFAEALITTSTPGLALVPATIDLSGAETELASAVGRETILADALEEWVAAGRAGGSGSPADYVIFDCPPSLGLLALNALAAADEVLITVQTEFLALQGMSKLVEIVQLVKRRLNPRLEISGILACLYDTRLRLAREVLAEIREHFPGLVMRTAIGTNVKLAEAPSYGRTILEYAPESRGAADYRAAAREILEQEARDEELAHLERPHFEHVVAARPTDEGQADGRPSPDEYPSPEEGAHEPADESPAENSAAAPVDTALMEGAPLDVPDLEEAPLDRASAEGALADEGPCVAPPSDEPMAETSPVDEPAAESAPATNTQGDVGARGVDRGYLPSCAPTGSPRKPLTPAERLHELHARPLPPLERPVPSAPGRLMRSNDAARLPADVFDNLADLLRRHL